MQTNSIANLKRTEPGYSRRQDLAHGTNEHLRSTGSASGYETRHVVLRGIIANIMMLASWVSFHPFKAVQEETTGGDIVNQLGFGLLSILCLASFASLIDRRLLGRLLSPSYLLLGTVLIFSVAASSNPGASFRAMIFSVIVMLAAVTVMTLPRNLSQIALFIGAGCLISLLFSYFAILAYPLEAIHHYVGAEGEHGGLWRGIYDHKNVAGAVMAMFAIFGIFVLREGYRPLGFSIVILALLFLFNAGSKTSGLLLPFAVLYAAIVSSFKSPAMRFGASLIPLTLLLTMTVGSAAFDEINQLLQSIAPGTTYTGRLDLWQYTIERIGERPFAGFGFENFWGTPAVTNTDKPIELSWDIREIVHAHNSYLDAIISFGLPGLAIVLFVLILLPAIDFARIGKDGASKHFSTMLLAIWIFASLDACLESFFFRRADPVWFCMLLAVIGLRLLASGKATQSRP